MLRYASLLCACIVALTFTACKKQTPAEAAELPPLSYAPYISGFSNGLVGSRDKVSVQFPYVRNDVERGQAADASLLKISPAIAGELVWSQRSMLSFIPSEAFRQNTTYTATLDLKALQPQVHDSLAKFSFSFTILQQGLDLLEARVRPDPLTDDPKLRQVIGAMTSYDYAEPKDIEQILTASQNGKELDVAWTHQDRGRLHNFAISGVARGQQEGEVVIRARGDALGIQFDTTLSVSVPSLNDFKVTGIEVDQTADQVVSIFFSDNLKADADLEGLIHLADNTPLRLLVQGNAILAYPANRRAGNHELIIEAGIENAAGGKLATSDERIVAFTDLKPAIQLVGDGVIVPSSEGMTVPFKAVALSSVDVEIIRIYEDNVLQFMQDNALDGVSRLTRVGRPVYRGKVQLTSTSAIDYLNWNYFSIDISKYIAVEPGAIYRVVLDFGPADSRYPCDEVLEIPISAANQQSELTEFNSLDYYSSYENSYYYRGEEGEEPCNLAYYSGRAVAKNFMASNIGLLAKKGAGNELLVVATDLLSADPLGGVEVTLYNVQQQPITTATTSANGVAVFNVDYQPFVAVGKLGEQRAYLHLSDGYAINTSTFDVSGERVYNGTRGFIYGERGVWRPGDSIYLTLILEQHEEMGTAQTAIFELYNPAGQRIVQRAILPSTPEMYSLRTATSIDDPTGLYTAKVQVGARTLTKAVRVETVMPNRLKVELDFDSDPVALHTSQEAQLQAKWLMGANAGSLSADVNFSGNSINPVFKGYEGFDFKDETKSFSVSDQVLFNGKLKEDGTANVDLQFEDLASIPGLIKGRFTTRVFEKTGAFSTITQNATLSPFESYVGVKLPENQSYYGLNAATPQDFEIVVVDEFGNRINRASVDVEIYNIEWSYWWERRSRNRLANYVSNRAQYIALEQKQKLDKGAGTFRADLSQLTYGRKMIRVIDTESGHSSSAVFYVEDPRWAYDASSRPGGAELLTFNLDKEKYTTGENIKVALPAFNQGRALVCIENGNRVLSYQWVEGQAQPQEFSIETTADMAPNAYVSVTLIQPHGQTANDQPIRMYGIQPFTVEDPDSRLSPKLAIAAELSPEGPFTVQVSEADGRAMSYSLAIVEEGLLDITSFKTPDPYARFNRHTALGVKTWDLFKHVLGAFTGKLAGMLAIGGDEDTGETSDPRANRFRPVVKYVGPFELNAGEKAKHTFDMPNYIGSVRAMVVAAKDGAYGAAEETRPVKRPLMVLATLPRVLGPGEVVNLPVTVFGMDPKIKDVSVSLEGLKMLDADATQKVVSFSEPGEKIITFQLRVPEKLGLGKVRVVANGAGFSASDEIELDVRAPNPRITDVERAVLEPGESWSTNYTALGMEGTNEGSLEVSGNLSVNLDNRLRYLIRYPHGCLEQTVSGAFPQLFLGDITQLTERQQDNIQNNINAALRKLKRFEIGDGRYSYWPGRRNHYSVWASIYAAHFQIEAQEAGYRIPDADLKRWKSFARQQANAWAPNNTNGYYGNDLDVTQAYRLMVLAKAQHPQLGAMNRLRNYENLSAPARNLLVVAYALAGQRDAARKLLEKALSTSKNYGHYSYTYGDNARDQGIGLLTQQLLGNRNNAYKLAEETANNLSSERWYSTQSTAWQLIAMAKYLKDEKTDKPLAYAYSISKVAEQVTQPEQIKLIDLDPPTDVAQPLKITNTGEGRMYVRLMTSGLPKTSQKEAKSSNINMSVRYTDLGGKDLDVSDLRQGQDFLAQVTIKHPGVLSSYENLALTQIFPSGWEIRNERLEGGGEPKGVDYQDIRDDRVLSYFSLNKAKKLTITTQLNAAYVGRYYLPDRYCEEMYDNDVSARVPGRWVEVN